MEKKNKKKYLRLVGLIVLIIFLFAAFDVRLMVSQFLCQALMILM